ncbi:hypothetical protein DSM112329_03287 [Paraconexibacter sp. AEG42_29]|uniref:CpXC domain-containing protein n=1 Tax=Paraconexibacter sp. AEG42_29 TaxID=2997339 RepID=A0AAU7AXR1_9ACTN
MFEHMGQHETATLPIIGDAPLHQCRCCSSSLVQLVEYQDAGEGHWHLTLHCPECETFSAGTATDEVCAAFDLELEQGTEELFVSLLQLQRDQMMDDVEQFVAALAADLVLPEDF